MHKLNDRLFRRFLRELAVRDATQLHIELQQIVPTINQLEQVLLDGKLTTINRKITISRRDN